MLNLQIAQRPRMNPLPGKTPPEKRGRLDGPTGTLPDFLRGSVHQMYRSTDTSKHIRVHGRYTVAVPQSNCVSCGVVTPLTPLPPCQFSHLPSSPQPPSLTPIVSAVRRSDWGPLIGGNGSRPNLNPTFLVPRSTGSRTHATSHHNP